MLTHRKVKQVASRYIVNSSVIQYLILWWPRYQNFRTPIQILGLVKLIFKSSQFQLCKRLEVWVEFSKSQMDKVASIQNKRSKIYSSEFDINSNVAALWPIKTFALKVTYHWLGACGISVKSNEGHRGTIMFYHNFHSFESYCIVPKYTVQS